MRQNPQLLLHTVFSLWVRYMAMTQHTVTDGRRPLIFYNAFVMFKVFVTYNQWVEYLYDPELHIHVCEYYNSASRRPSVVVVKPWSPPPLG
jgi:hypothetical protein